MQRGDLQGGLVVQLRQDRRQTLGEHRLAGSRWADECQVVPTGGGDLHGPPAQALPGDLGQVGTGCGRRRSVERRLDQRGAVTDEGDQPVQGVHAAYQQPGDDRRLGGVAGRDDHPLDAGLRRRGDHRQYAPDRSHGPVQAQLPEDRHAVQRQQRKLAGATEQCHRDRQVEGRTELGQGGR
ncbi:hypothetical protein GCM10029963_30320 [Micromonospora andamanensis]